MTQLRARSCKKATTVSPSLHQHDQLTISTYRPWRNHRGLRRTHSQVSRAAREAAQARDRTDKKLIGRLSRSVVTEEAEQLSCMQTWNPTARTTTLRRRVPYQRKFTFTKRNVIWKKSLQGKNNDNVVSRLQHCSVLSRKNWSSCLRRSPLAAKISMV